MYIDKENLFSKDQVVTAAAASTDIIDLGAARDIGVSGGLDVFVSVTEAALAAGAATVQIQLQTDDNAGFSSPKIVSQTDAVPKASLVAGYQTYLPVPVGTNERYLRVYFNVATGPLTAGKFTSGVVKGIQKSTAYPDAL